MIKEFTPLVAILVIGGLEAAAIAKGINGAALAGALVIIASLGTWQAKAARDRRQSLRNKEADHE